ncbi:mucin-2-like [Bombina bombina]|uniref:mucin-2-like n=1 Tax=Bombina bombina TaxID=8345 RepID=UPI00235B2E85|nr:mucin-2-like [Bombina bombina]
MYFFSLLFSAFFSYAKDCSDCSKTYRLCEQFDGYVKCSCDYGSIGDGFNCTQYVLCDTNPCCPTGYIFDSLKCVNINECKDPSAYRCEPASCTDKNGTYLCSSKIIKTCGVSTCSSNDDCVSTNGTLTCVDPCAIAKEIDGASRLYTIKSNGRFPTDRYKFGWFRFSPGYQMKVGCVGPLKCGSREPFTLSKNHPEIGAGIQLVPIVNNDLTACTTGASIPVKACDGYYVYKFSGTLKFDVYCSEAFIPPTTKTTTIATTTTEHSTDTTSTQQITSESTTTPEPVTSKEPTTKPATKEPTTRHTTKEPTTEPTTKETTTEPTTKEPTTEPTTKEPTTEPTTTKEPTTEPTTKKLTTVPTTTKEPPTEARTTEEPPTEPTTTVKPVTESSTTGEPTIAPTTPEESTAEPTSTYSSTSSPPKPIERIKLKISIFNDLELTNLLYSNHKISTNTPLHVVLEAQGLEGGEHILLVSSFFVSKSNNSSGTDFINELISGGCLLNDADNVDGLVSGIDLKEASIKAYRVSKNNQLETTPEPQCKKKDQGICKL